MKWPILGWSTINYQQRKYKIQKELEEKRAKRKMNKENQERLGQVSPPIGLSGTMQPGLPEQPQIVRPGIEVQQINSVCFPLHELNS